MFLICRYAKEQKAKRLHDIKENELVKQIIDENRKKAIEAIPVHDQPQPIGLPGYYQAQVLYYITRGQTSYRVFLLLIDRICEHLQQQGRLLAINKGECSFLEVPYIILAWKSYAH